MLEKITDRIYYMKHAEETDRPALGLVIGDECCLVVDAGASPKHAREFRYNFFDAGKLFPMIDAIEQREADYYLCSHEPLIPRNELADLWAKLRAGHELATKCSNYAEALAAYQSKYPETPEKEAEFYIKSFGLRV